MRTTPDLPPRWRNFVPASRGRRRMNCISAAQIVKLMLGARPTLADLVDATGLSLHTVRAYVKAMHIAKACHIVGWAMSDKGVYTTPQWALGSMPDAPKPKPLTSAERMRAYRARKAMIILGKPAPSVLEIARKLRAEA